MMWVFTFVDAIQQGASFSFSLYVTSAFNQHSLTAYIGVMSGTIGGVLKLPLAKILDIFGRPQGYGIMIAFLTVGLIMMAACDNVQTYVAAQIFYWIGSALQTIITVWITGPLATAVYNGSGWRLFYGAFAIITVVVNAPLLVLFWVNYRKAVRAGTIVPVKSTRTFVESFKHYLIEFDVGGLVLLIGGLVFFLLPFSLYSDQNGRWNSPLVSAFLIIGVLTLVGFALYERFIAPKNFIPYELLLDRTVLGACVVSGVFFISFYCWNVYFFSFLQVVSGLNITEATYVTNIYSIGACFRSLVVGLLIRWTGRFKWLALYFGVPVTVFGTGLMIHFRQPDVDVGWVVMSQIFIAFAGGAIVITEQIAAMAATTHQYVAVVLAIEGMFSSVGGAIGSSASAAIWTGVFPANLARYLPTEAQGNLGDIYAALPVQSSYPKGTPNRYAIEQAYGESHK